MVAKQTPQDSHDEEDVKAVLERETHGGSGFGSEDELSESDFVSFSEPEVENNHDGDNEPAVTQEDDK